MAVPLIVELLVYAVFLEAGRRIAVATSSMAHPNPIVASHRSPVPYLGGTGLFLAFAGLSILRWAADGSEPGAGQVLLVTSAVAMTGVGTWDDLKALAPARKVVLEAAASLPFAV